MNIRARCLSLLVLPFLFGQAYSAQGDPAVVDRIIQEGKENSHVWNTLLYLSEEIGPRLTGSERLMRANTWTRDEFRRMGLKNAHLFKWGEVPVRFDRGPSYARMVSPTEREFEFTTRSWSGGTDGPLRAPVLMYPKTMKELEEIGFWFENAWVLVEPQSRGRRRGQETDEQKAAREEREAIDAALEEIGIAGRLVSSSNDLVLTSSARGWRDLTMDDLPQDIEVQIRKSDYEALAAEVQAGNDVVVEVDLANNFVEGPFGCYNTIAEIPGTEKPDEVIICSGHLDSWDGPGSMGSQDNGTGCSVNLEAARLLMAAGAQPKRTIRFILWSGEEQGLFGSRGYVDSLSEEERAKISLCLVDDGGTNYEGGLQCIESMKPMLDEAIAPVQAAFPDLPMENNVRDRMPRGGGSDHASFNGVGIPGFFWNESGSGGREGKDYNFVHHTQHDTPRYAVEEYLVQSAVCMAVTAYQLADADTLLPREIPGEEKPAAEPAVDPTFELTQGPFTGEWDVTMVGAEAPDIGFVVALEMARDGRLRGTMTGMTGSEPITEGSWNAEAETASFATMTDFGKLLFDVHVEEGVLLGSFAVNGMEMEIRGEPRTPVETPISGTWKGLITSMDADFTVSFQVADDGTLKGRFKSSQSDSELYGGKWDPDKKTLSFEYDYPHAGRLPVTAHLEGEKLVGTIGENADFVAERVAAE